MFIAIGVSLISVPLNGQSFRIYVCMSTNPQVHTDLNLFLYLYILKTMSSYWCLQLQSKTTGFILAFSLALYFTSFYYRQWENWLSLFTIYSYVCICLTPVYTEVVSKLWIHTHVRNKFTKLSILFVYGSFYL